jgi:hypothetical protein
MAVGLDELPEPLIQRRTIKKKTVKCEPLTIASISNMSAGLEDDQGPLSTEFRMASQVRLLHNAAERPRPRTDRARDGPLSIGEHYLS